MLAAALFTKEKFDEEEVIEDVAVMMAQLEPYITFPNDLLSFYKEMQDPDVCATKDTSNRRFENSEANC